MHSLSIVSNSVALVVITSLHSNLINLAWQATWNDINYYKGNEKKNGSAGVVEEEKEEKIKPIMILIRGNF